MSHLTVVCVTFILSYMITILMVGTGTFHQPKGILHKVEKALMLETDVPEIVNEMIVSVKKGGRCGVIAAYAGFTNHFNIGALMEKGVRFIGNGQAPVHKWWKEILDDYIKTGKFDPTLYVFSSSFCTSTRELTLTPCSMISHRVPIDDFPKLYYAFDKRQNGVMKVFVETKFSAPPSSGCPKVSRVDDWGKV